MTAVTEREALDASAKRVSEMLGQYLSGRQVRFRYFQRGNGPMFCWTIEKIDGKYQSYVYRPTGPGTRVGKAEEWQLVEAPTSKWKQVRHAKRKAAKARALRLYRADQDASA